MSSEDEAPKGELAELEELERLDAAYGGAMSAAEKLRRRRFILNKYSKKGRNGEAQSRAVIEWKDVPGKTKVKAKSFKEARAQMKGDWKADKDCRGGRLGNFKGDKDCVYRRRVAIIDGTETLWRMVQRTDQTYTFQTGRQIGKDEDCDDDDENDAGEDDDEEEQQSAAADVPPAASRKRAAPQPEAKNPKAKAKEVVEEPPAAVGKRQRKQVVR